jgi:hypothetical protein
MPSQLKYPNLVTEGSGGTAWSSRDSVKTDNSTGASVYGSTYGHGTPFFGVEFFNSNTLTLSDFGFTIPSGSVIDGVVIKVKGSASTSTETSPPSGSFVVQTALSGTNNGNSQGNSLTNDNGYTTYTYGSSSNKLGITLSVSDFNSSSFQIKLDASLSVPYDYESVEIAPGFFVDVFYGSDITANFDYVSVEVHYTETSNNTSAMFMVF